LTSSGVTDRTLVLEGSNGTPLRARAAADFGCKAWRAREEMTSPKVLWLPVRQTLGRQEDVIVNGKRRSHGGFTRNHQTSYI